MVQGHLQSFFFVCEIAIFLTGAAENSILLGSYKVLSSKLLHFEEPRTFICRMKQAKVTYSSSTA